MSNEYLHLKAEVGQLEAMLSELDESAIIERMGFEHRLNELNERLKTLSPTPSRKTLDITFRGQPVIGSHAVKAGFASKAAELFSDAYDMVVAALNGTLTDASSGPIAEKEKYELFISDVAVGSFGFQFELPEIQNDLLDERPVSERAVMKIEQIFQAAAEEDDEGVAEAIDAIPARTISKIHSFLDQLEKNKAWCGLAFGKNRFQFQGLEQIQRAANQLKGDNIIEERKSFSGVLKGFLPSAKTFEFALDEDNEVISGKIAPEFENPDALNSEWLHKPATIICTEVTVGKGRPRYVLVNISGRDG